MAEYPNNTIYNTEVENADAESRNNNGNNNNIPLGCQSYHNDILDQVFDNFDTNPNSQFNRDTSFLPVYRTINTQYNTELFQFLGVNTSDLNFGSTSQYQNSDIPDDPTQSNIPLYDQPEFEQPNQQPIQAFAAPSNVNMPAITAEANIHRYVENQPLVQNPRQYQEEAQIYDEILNDIYRWAYNQLSNPATPILPDNAITQGLDQGYLTVSDPSTSLNIQTTPNQLHTHFPTSPPSHAIPLRSDDIQYTPFQDSLKRSREEESPVVEDEGIEVVRYQNKRTRLTYALYEEDNINSARSSVSGGHSNSNESSNGNHDISPVTNEFDAIWAKLGILKVPEEINDTKKCIHISKEKLSSKERCKLFSLFLAEGDYKLFNRNDLQTHPMYNSKYDIPKSIHSSWVALELNRNKSCGQNSDSKETKKYERLKYHQRLARTIKCSVESIQNPLKNIRSRGIIPLEKYTKLEKSLCMYQDIEENSLDEGVDVDNSTNYGNIHICDKYACPKKIRRVTEKAITDKKYAHRLVKWLGIKKAMSSDVHMILNIIKTNNEEVFNQYINELCWCTRKKGRHNIISKGKSASANIQDNPILGGVSQDNTDDSNLRFRDGLKFVCVSEVQGAYNDINELFEDLRNTGWYSDSINDHATDPIALFKRKVSATLNDLIAYTFERYHYNTESRLEFRESIIIDQCDLFEEEHIVNKSETCEYRSLINEAWYKDTCGTTGKISDAEINANILINTIIGCIFLTRSYMSIFKFDKNSKLFVAILRQRKSNSLQKRKKGTAKATDDGDNYCYYVSVFWHKLSTAMLQDQLGAASTSKDIPTNRSCGLFKHSVDQSDSDARSVYIHQDN